MRPQHNNQRATSDASQATAIVNDPTNATANAPDGCGTQQNELRPAKQKRDQASVGMSQVNVDSSRTGKHRGKFGETHGAQDAEQATRDPNREDQTKVPGGCGDITRLEKNSRTYHIANDHPQSPCRVPDRVAIEVGLLLS